MGLFSSKKTYVSSTLYNLAGDEKERPNYLKTLVLNRMLVNPDQPMSDVIQRGYLGGPGFKLQKYMKWAIDNYDTVGVAQGRLYSNVHVSEDAVAIQIPHGSGETIFVGRVTVAMAEYSYWAEQYMLANYPELTTTDWTSDFNETTGKVVITLSDDTEISIDPVGFNKGSLYIYALYQTLTGANTGATIIGAQATVTSYPSTSGYTVGPSTLTPTSVTLNKSVKTTKSYSDGRPDEVTTVPSSSSQSYNYYRAQFDKTVYMGRRVVAGTAEMWSKHDTLRLYRDANVTSGVTTNTTVDDQGTLIITTKVETTQEYLNVVLSTRIDVQEIVHSAESAPELFIYEIGSGNAALDALLSEDGDIDGYYVPFIPARLDNKFISPSFQPAAYEQATKAYEKATGGKFDELIQSLATSSSLNDIDYAYIMCGVPLNTKDKAGREYLYRYFDKLRLTQTVGLSDYSTWLSQQMSTDTQVGSWVAWNNAQSNPSNPLYGTPEPDITGSYAPPMNSLRIQGNGSLNTNMNIEISWQSITRTTGTGLGKSGAKVGEYWISWGGSVNLSNSVGGLMGLLNPVASLGVTQLLIYHQIDTGNYEVLSIMGATHKNYIYDGKFVETTAESALSDAEESGFLVPIHMGTFNDMQIKDSTQLSTTCYYMLVDSYLVKKTGFFQSTFFRILLVVVVIAVIVVSGGIGATSVGILGTNAAVGAAIGLTGLAAVLAGAIANAIAAMIITKIIGLVSTTVLGEKWGQIIGAIVSVVAITVGVGIAGGSTFSQAMQTMTSPMNLVNLTSAAGNGIAGAIAADAMKYAQKTQDLIKDYEDQTKKLDAAWADNFGLDRAMLDPMGLLHRDDFYIEPRNTFLSRTLMTGSDMAEFTNGYVSNFADINLDLSLNL